jgi:hypothetical protein
MTNATLQLHIGGEEQKVGRSTLNVRDGQHMDAVGDFEWE